MGQETFFELTRRRIPRIKNDGMYLSWHDSVINVRADRGMTFFEFSYNLECLDKTIDLLEFSLPNPKTSPATELWDSNFIGSEMQNYEYTEMIINPSFWPHNKSLTNEMTCITMSAWSPTHFIENRSVLAILNNIGGVEIFMQKQCMWESVLDLSTYIQKRLKYNKSPKDFEDLKKSVYIVETSAVCWAPELNSNRSCYLVTAQKNGAILIWEIYAYSKPIMAVCMQSNTSEIHNMLWIRTSNNTFWLICANILGNVCIFDMHIDKGVISHQQSYDLWKYKDRMIASHLHYMEMNGNIVILYAKHRHLVVQIIDKNCNILSQYVNNINDYKISDITKSINGYYVATINVKIFKLNVSFIDSSLIIDLIPIELKDSYQNYELYSLSFSNNHSMAVLGMIDRKLHCRKEIYKVDVIFVTSESMLEGLVPKLLENPSKKLTQYWDCIEVLRYKIMKTVLMPDIDYNLLYTEGSNDAYKLKVYLILQIIYVNMRKMAWVVKNCTMPELSIDNVKEKLLLLHAQTNLDILYKKHKEDGKLNEIEEEMLYGSVKYLHFYAKKNKSDLVIDNGVYSIMKDQLKYTCQSCDNNITDDFTCENGHLNMYCMLSFTPITSDNYLVCKPCGSTSRTDVVSKPLCVFCDQLLSKVD